MQADELISRASGGTASGWTLVGEQGPEAGGLHNARHGVPGQPHARDDGRRRHRRSCCNWSRKRAPATSPSPRTPAGRRACCRSSTATGCPRARHMKIIRPITITEAELVSSTVNDSDYDEWVAGDTYTYVAGAAPRVQYTVGDYHHVYENLATVNDSVAPPSSTAKWLLVSDHQPMEDVRRHGVGPDHGLRHAGRDPAPRRAIRCSGVHQRQCGVRARRRQ